MAFTSRETIIANPGRKAGKMTAKQLKYFGTKRQKAAAKAARKRKSSASHRPRSKPKSNPAKKHKAPARKSSAPRKKKAAAKSTPKRKNFGQLFALTGNPAKGHSMAKTKKKRKSSASSHKTAGSRSRGKKNPGHRPRSRRHNPGQLGGPMEWITGGVGAVIGGVGAPALTQLVLSSSNTGVMGYFGNAVAIGLLATAAHFAAPKYKFLSMGIVFGGAGSIIRRVISDYSLLGSYSSSVGLGDYVMNFNYPIPQYLQPGNNRSLTPYGGTSAAATTPVVVNGAQGAGMSSLYGARLY